MSGASHVKRWRLLHPHFYGILWCGEQYLAGPTMSVKSLLRHSSTRSGSTGAAGHTPVPVMALTSASSRYQAGMRECLHGQNHSYRGCDGRQLSWGGDGEGGSRLRAAVDSLRGGEQQLELLDKLREAAAGVAARGHQHLGVALRRLRVLVVRALAVARRRRVPRAGPCTSRSAGLTRAPPFDSSTSAVSRGGPGVCTPPPAAAHSRLFPWLVAASLTAGQTPRAQESPSPGERMCGACELVSASAPAAAAARFG